MAGPTERRRSTQLASDDELIFLALQADVQYLMLTELIDGVRREWARHGVAPPPELLRIQRQEHDRRVRALRAMSRSP